MRAAARFLPVFLLSALMPMPAGAREVEAFLAGLQIEAAAQGVPENVFAAALKDFAPDAKVLAATRRQPELTKTAPQYLALLLTSQRIAAGRDMLTRNAGLFADIEARFGVDRYTLAALWGVESNYGAVLGRYNIAHALASLIYADIRASFARTQLFALLRLAAAGDLVLPVKGSWAGAMGQMQFIPTSYEHYAVDYDGGGRKDLFAKEDALASAAHYLVRSGWQRWRVWGIEVLLPRGFDSTSAGLKRKPLSFAEWRKKGVRDISGLPLAGAGSAKLMLPAGQDGPAFLVTGNFDALLKYNNSQLYALAIAQLARALQRQSGILARWPGEKAKPLSFSERQEIQRRLARRGFSPGAADGVIGPKSRAMIRAWRRANNLPASGDASLLLLRLLRSPPGVLAGKP